MKQDVQIKWIPLCTKLQNFRKIVPCGMQYSLQSTARPELWCYPPNKKCSFATRIFTWRVPAFFFVRRHAIFMETPTVLCAPFSTRGKRKKAPALYFWFHNSLFLGVYQIKWEYQVMPKKEIKWKWRVRCYLNVVHVWCVLSILGKTQFISVTEKHQNSEIISNRSTHDNC